MKGRAELFRALGALCEGPDPSHTPVARALELPGVASEHEHTDLFGFQLYPYASVYLGEEGMLGGEARDRIAGFWRALGLLPPKEPDHLAALLSLYASTIEAELAEVDPARRLLWTQSRKALLWEHLLSWLPAYLDKLAQVAPPYYARWAEVLEQSLVAEAAMLGRQDRLSLHLRASPGSTPTRGREFVAWLLAPVRSGIVLVRSDLERAASELKLGLRIGERRWVLQSLLSQEPACTLTWLAAETQRWAALHERWTPVTGDFAWFWLGRARAAEDLLLAAVPVASPSTR